MVWHAGTFPSDGNYVVDGMMHFGTKKAAIDRARTKLISCFLPIRKMPQTKKPLEPLLTTLSEPQALKKLKEVSIRAKEEP